MNSPVLLYVEDSLDDRILFKEACQQADVPFQVVFAGDGKEAIEYLGGSGKFVDRAIYPIPDGILLDIKMPLVDGFGVLSWLRNQEQFVSLPVFVYTSSYQHADIKRAYEAKATAFLTKPSDFKNLIRLVKALYECFAGAIIQVDPLRGIPQFKQP